MTGGADAVIGGSLGLLAALGLVLVVAGIVPRPAPIRGQETLAERWARLTRRPSGAAGRRRDLRLGVSAVGGLVALVVTGLPIMLIAVPVAVLVLPWLLSNPNSAAIERTAGIEGWVRSLRSLLLSGSDSTLEGAITSSLATAPEQVAEPVRLLVARINARWSTEAALARFADELADPTADVVVASLILSARRRGTGLAEVLDGLSVAVADEVRARRRIESERSTARAAARYMTLIFAVMAVGLAVLNPTYLDPYRTPSGQVVLVVAIAGFLASLWLIRRITTVRDQPRIRPGGRWAGTRDRPGGPGLATGATGGSAAAPKPAGDGPGRWG